MLRCTCLVPMMIGCQERAKCRRGIPEEPDQIPHRHRTKSVGPETIKPGTIKFGVSGRARQKGPSGRYIFGFGAGPVGLKFAGRTMVRLK